MDSDIAKLIITVLTCNVSGLNFWLVLLLCITWVAITALKVYGNFKIAECQNRSETPVQDVSDTRVSRHKKNRKG